jgi:Ca2+-binding EF-hand superfamily protein
MTRTISTIAMLASLALSGTALAADPFSLADTNGDGALDASEFKAFIDAAAAAGKPKAAKVKANNMYTMAFSRIDKNGDGQISKKEVAGMR